MLCRNKTTLRFCQITTLLFKHATIQTASRCFVDAKTTIVSTSKCFQSISKSPISYSNLLSQCVASKSLTLGLELLAHLIKFGFSRDPSLKNDLITLYSKCHHFRYAHKLVDQSTELDLVVSWSALISGYVQNGFGEEALLAFNEMCLLGVMRNEFSFPSVLKACSMKKDLNFGMKVHGMTMVTGFESDGFVANTLVVMYAKCGKLCDSRKLFGAIVEPGVVSWNALFSCYIQSDFLAEAVDLFRGMVEGDVRPNEYSLSIILNACAGLQDGRLGRTVHGLLMKLGHGFDQFSKNALVDKYAKGRRIEDAVDIFREIAHPVTVSWNAHCTKIVFSDRFSVAKPLKSVAN